MACCSHTVDNRQKDGWVIGCGGVVDLFSCQVMKQNNCKVLDIVPGSNK
jgi:hypothetical protein